MVMRWGRRDRGRKAINCEYSRTHILLLPGDHLIRGSANRRGGYRSYRGSGVEEDNPPPHREAILQYTPLAADIKSRLHYRDTCCTPIPFFCHPGPKAICLTLPWTNEYVKFHSCDLNKPVSFRIHLVYDMFNEIFHHVLSSLHVNKEIYDKYSFLRAAYESVVEKLQSTHNYSENVIISYGRHI